MNPFEAFGVWLSNSIAWLLDFVVAIGPVWGTLIASLGIFLETTLFIGLVVPGDTIVVTAATAVRDPLHFFILWASVIIATLAGQSLGFGLGRWVGPAIRGSRLGRRLGDENWARAAAFVDRRGGVAVFVSRFLPVLHALMPVTVGMSTMPYRRFIAWAAPAALIWASAYVSAGTFAGVAFRDLLISGLHWAGYVFVTVIVAFVVAVWLVKRRLSRATAADEPLPHAKIDVDVRDDDGV